MRPSSYVSSFYFYKLAQALSGPYTALEAYNAGTIDANGNIIKPESSIDSFEYLVIKLKKIFEELPYGTTKAKLSNYMATLNMFGEDCQLPFDQYSLFLEGYIAANVNQEISYISLLEDTTSGGGAGGLGVPAGPVQNNGSVLGYDPVLAMGLQKRKKPKYFDGCEVFEVCPEELVSFKGAKQWKDVPDSETKNYLQRFQRRNKAAKIGVVGKNPISGDQDLFWITYPSKNFLGEGKNDPVKIMVQNVVSPPPEDFDKKGKPIPGVATERLGQLVLGGQSLTTANKTGSRELVRGVEDKLQDIAGKAVPKNGTDSFYLNPETMEIEGKDIKGHTNTSGGRINVGDYGNFGSLADIMGKIKETMKDTDLDPEDVEKVKEQTRAALRQLDKTHGSQLKDAALENETGEDLAIFPDVSSKKFRFPFLPTFVPRTKQRGLLAQSNFRFGLETRPGRAEVKVRPSPDFSTETAQSIMVKDSATGKMTSAQMDPETMDLILGRVEPGLRAVMKQTLEPYVRR